jgi:hypothetical protein
MMIHGGDHEQENDNQSQLSSRRFNHGNPEIAGQPEVLQGTAVLRGCYRGQLLRVVGWGHISLHCAIGIRHKRNGLSV